MTLNRTFLNGDRSITPVKGITQAKHIMKQDAKTHWYAGKKAFVCFSRLFDNSGRLIREYYSSNDEVFLLADFTKK